MRTVVVSTARLVDTPAGLRSVDTTLALHLLAEICEILARRVEGKQE